MIVTFSSAVIGQCGSFDADKEAEMDSRRVARARVFLQMSETYLAHIHELKGEAEKASVREAIHRCLDAVDVLNELLQDAKEG